MTANDVLQIWENWLDTQGYDSDKPKSGEELTADWIYKKTGDARVLQYIQAQQAAQAAGAPVLTFEQQCQLDDLVRWAQKNPDMLRGMLSDADYCDKHKRLTNATLKQYQGHRYQKQIEEQALKDLLKRKDKDGFFDDRKKLRDMYMCNLESEYSRENDERKREKQKTWTLPTRMSHDAIAEMLMAEFTIIRVVDEESTKKAGDEKLFVYNTTGPKRGIYTDDGEALDTAIKDYADNFDDNDYKHVYAALKRMAPKRQQCSKREYIAVGNGIYNYDTDELLEFTPDEVFLSKVPVDYNPNATDVTFADGWNVETGFDVFARKTNGDIDTEKKELLFKLVCLSMRNLVNVGKIFCLVGQGNNGKGTLLDLMRNLNQGYTAALSLEEPSQDKFCTGRLVGKKLILSDETDVNAALKSNKLFKQIATHDIITINEKNEKGYDIRANFQTFQSLNSMPKSHDITHGFMRRLMFIKMETCFTGVENRNVKEVYLKDRRVLEYVLKRCLHDMPKFYDIAETEEATEAIKDYAIQNNDAIAFLYEFLDRSHWNFIPYDYAWSAFRAWYKSVNGFDASKYWTAPRFKEVVCDALSGNKFTDLTEMYTTKGTKDKDKQYISKRCNHFEPLISEYGIEDYRTDMTKIRYTGKNSNSIKDTCDRYTSSSIRKPGLMRVHQMPAGGEIEVYPGFNVSYSPSLEDARMIWDMLVKDGRSSDKVSVKELTDYMFELKCTGMLEKSYADLKL